MFANYLQLFLIESFYYYELDSHPASGLQKEVGDLLLCSPPNNILYNIIMVLYLLYIDSEIDKNGMYVYF